MPKSKRAKIPDHQREALRRRLVEAELHFQLLDEIGIEALRAAILRVDGVAAGSQLPRGALRKVAAARNARGPAGVRARELRDHALDRAARRELHDDEGDEEDPEQGRDHQQDAAGDVGAHGCFACSSLAALPPSYHQMSGAPTPLA
ncbi:hypothetical protein ACVWZV_000477 [Bradyrhizobium sp. GM5.1]